MTSRPRLLERLVAPGTEPLSLSDTKVHLRVDGSDEDTQISAMLVGARQAAEQHMRRSLITQQWLLAYDDYPPFQPTLPYGPVQQVDGITLVEEDGNSTIFDTTNYYLDASRRHIHFNVTPLSHRLEIRYTTGYGNASSDVPDAIKQGILHHVKALHERDGASAIPKASLALYRPYREVRL